MRISGDFDAHFRARAAMHGYAAENAPGGFRDRGEHVDARAAPAFEARRTRGVISQPILEETSMKHLLIALSLATVAGHASARPARSPAASDAASATSVAAAQPGTPQRSKMKICNADAKVKALHGDDRRAFMKQCLSGKAKPAVAS